MRKSIMSGNHEKIIVIKINNLSLHEMILNEKETFIMHAKKMNCDLIKTHLPHQQITEYMQKDWIM